MALLTLGYQLSAAVQTAAIMACYSSNVESAAGVRCLLKHCITSTMHQALQCVTARKPVVCIRTVLHSPEA
jgi:hypothetical protein